MSYNLPFLSHRAVIFEYTLDPILVTDDEGKCVDVNPAGCKLFGFERDKIIGESFTEFVNPRKIQEVNEKWSKFKEKKLLSGEVELVRKDGQNRLLEYKIFPNIRPHLHLSILKDITVERQISEERRRVLELQQAASRELQQLADQQEQFLTLSRMDLQRLKEEREVRERFVATLTHDLRNPLTSIKTNAQLLLRSKDMFEIKDKIAIRILSGIERADRMIDDLLDASSIRAGKILPIQVASCDLKEIFREILEDLTLVHGNRFFFKCELQLVQGFWCNRSLRRIIENLANNAVKYGFADTPIILSLARMNEKVQISVHNEGQDLSPNELRTLFEPFQRTRSAKMSGKVGWGLGLTLVQGIAQSHGGKASVQNAPGQGITFIVELPLDARLSVQDREHWGGAEDE